MVVEMFPVRVLVETVRSQHCLGCAHDGNPLVDTYAVVGGQTMLCQLVETVLSALGLPHLVQDSKGMIQINGWKPISFEAITDNPEELVTKLFREISTHITLKILAKRSPSEPNGQCLSELKQRLLKTAIEKQPQILTTANGQEVKEILQQVIQGDEQCSGWLAGGGREQADAVNDWLEQMAAQQEERKSPLCPSVARFSPVSELPKLERWFRSDPNPSRQKLLSYVNILNNSPFRKANGKVSYQQICNWFVNQRRASQRALASTAPNRQQQQQANASSISPQKPMAMLPLNATGGAVSSHQMVLLNQLASALGTAGVDPAQLQQKLTAMFSGQQQPEDGCQPHIGMAGDHLIAAPGAPLPLASGPPLDIRAKFEGGGTGTEPGTSGERGGGNHQPTGQTAAAGGGGGHSDRMDGGSESPTGNDDLSVTSGGGGGLADGTRDSTACSPDDLFMDVQQTGTGQSVADEQQTAEEDEERDGRHSAAGLSLSQLLQPAEQPSTHGGTRTPPPSVGPTPAAAMAAAAAAFSSLMPPQTQLQLMNQLAMVNQLHQGISPQHPSTAPFGCSSGQQHHQLKQSPSSNSLVQLGARGEDQLQQQASGAEVGGGSGFSSPQQQGTSGSNGNGSNSQSRSRLMFDPLSELPILERWFEDNPHPGWLQIEQYTDFLNSMAYRQNYPPISTHNVKIWFKNRRAKTKRLMSTNEPQTMAPIAAQNGLASSR